MVSLNEGWDRQTDARTHVRMVRRIELSLRIAKARRLTVCWAGFGERYFGHIQSLKSQWRDSNSNRDICCTGKELTAKTPAPLGSKGDKNERVVPVAITEIDRDSRVF